MAQAPDADTEFGRACQLFDDSYVDSLGIVSLMAFIETTLGIELDEEGAFDSRFGTIDGIAAIIAARPSRRARVPE